MLSNLEEELNFVGDKKKLSWFNSALVDNFHFTRLVSEVYQARPDTSLRNVLYSIPPLCEYVASLKGRTLDRSNGTDEWTLLFEENRQLISKLAVRHGTQGNIPQRAAIVLDYLHVGGLIPDGTATVFELGCSAGLLGTALCTAQKLFSRSNGCSLAKEYFWLKRMPKIKNSHNISYRGYDRMVPPRKLVPFYVWDLKQRAKVARFANSFGQKGDLREGSFEDALRDIREADQRERIIILTSFVLYQLRNPELLVQDILDLVHMRGNVHWIDLSRNSGLNCLFQEQAVLQGDRAVVDLVPNHIYLSHNGFPVAKVINGTDDCPDWEYL